MKLALFITSLSLVATPLFATSPAGWISKQAVCLESKRNAALRDIPLYSEAEARRVAARIAASCSSLIPMEFNARERANIIAADRFELTKNLLAASRTKAAHASNK